MMCSERLEEYFQANAVPFQTVTHPQVFSAQQSARALHVSGREVAKVVLVRAGDKLAMLVLPAHLRVNFRLLAEALKVDHIELAPEADFAGIFPDCDIGAMPPFGNLYRIPVYLDATLSTRPEIVLRAGSYDKSLRIRMVDYKRLVTPAIVDYAY